MSRSLRSILHLFPILVLLTAFQAKALTTCTASSNDVNFGVAEGTSNADTSAVITITCATTAVSLLSTVRVRMCLNISDGANGGGQYLPRRLTNTFGDPIQFQIYRDPARSLIWGSSSVPAVPTPLLLDFEYSVVVIGGGNNVTGTMYARVPVQSGMAAGNYSNPFSAVHARLDYRYSEQLIGTPAYPSSCTTGGSGGGSTGFPFTATATVPNQCQFEVVTHLSFGSVAGTISANQDQISSIGLTCTSRTAWQLGLDNGLNASGNLRRMRLGASGSYVGYELYRDASRTIRWGNTLNSDTVTGTGTGALQTETVYGRVPAQPAVPAGSYADTITVTLTY